MQLHYVFVDMDEVALQDETAMKNEAFLQANAFFLDEAALQDDILENNIGLTSLYTKTPL